MSEQVRKMFSGISRKYDLLNQILSFGIHHRWRKKTVKLSECKPNFKILDTASGTGDLAFEYYKHLNGNCSITATDFCNEMLDVAREKSHETESNILFETADVMKLNYIDSAFDISSISFGIRNVDDPKTGISELARVTKPNGKVVVLEFGQATGLFGFLYDLYSRYYMPFMGKLIAGDDYAYSYLPKTAKKFPCKQDFVDIMISTNRFSNVTYTQLSGGIAYIYIGVVK